MACLVRVPTEIVKQRMQAGIHASIGEAVSTIMAKEGFMGFYTGYMMTVMREIPFAFIQFPIYEQLKVWWSERRGEQVRPYQGALCGSFAGAIAAAATTPLDVIKTRLMLGADVHGVPYKGIADTASRIWSTEGPMTLLSGIQPRVFWISLGGFVFLGAYEQASELLIPFQGDE